MVKLPGEYPWSSFRHNAMGLQIKTITPHPMYLSLGESSAERIVGYRRLFETELPKTQLDDIRQCTNKEWVIGSKRFVTEIECALGRKLNTATWGGKRK